MTHTDTPSPNSFSSELQNSPDVWVLDGSNSGSVDGLTTTRLVNSAAYGINARGGHITGPAVGRRESITYFELSPFITVDNHFVSGDFRLLRTNTGNLGGSFGAIFRHFSEERNVIFGANAFYDIDNTRGREFEEFSIGLELLSGPIDIRTNVYIPTGSSQQVLQRGIMPNSQTFVGNNFTFDSFARSSTAARGVDMLVTVPVPGQYAERVNLEASAGWYHFEPDGAGLRNTTGWAGPAGRVGVQQDRPHVCGSDWGCGIRQ